MATHSSTLAWKIPWTEEPGGLQSMGSLRVRLDWTTSLSLFTFHFHALEKEMATHSSVLAWRIPGTVEPGGLPSMGSHRVGHDWSNLAARCYFPGGSDVKNLPAMQETRVSSLGGEDPLEKGMATPSSILAWRIPRREEPVGYSPWSHKESGTQLSDQHPRCYLISFSLYRYRNCGLEIRTRSQVTQQHLTGHKYIFKIVQLSVYFPFWQHTHKQHSPRGSP